MAFAKLYEHPEMGQILVTIGEDDDGEVELKFSTAPAGLGVCSVSYKFGDGDDDAAWDKVLEAFDECDQSRAEEVARGVHDAALQVGGGA